MLCPSSALVLRRVDFFTSQGDLKAAEFSIDLVSRRRSQGGELSEDSEMNRKSRQKPLSSTFRPFKKTQKGPTSSKAELKQAFPILFLPVFIRCIHQDPLFAGIGWKLTSFPATITSHGPEALISSPSSNANNRPDRQVTRAHSRQNAPKLASNRSQLG